MKEAREIFEEGEEAYNLNLIVHFELLGADFHDHLEQLSTFSDKIQFLSECIKERTPSLPSSSTHYDIPDQAKHAAIVGHLEVLKLKLLMEDKELALKELIAENKDRNRIFLDRPELNQQLEKREIKISVMKKELSELKAKQLAAKIERAKAVLDYEYLDMLSTHQDEIIYIRKYSYLNEIRSTAARLDKFRSIVTGASSEPPYMFDSNSMMVVPKVLFKEKRATKVYRHTFPIRSSEPPQLTFSNRDYLAIYHQLEEGALNGKRKELMKRFGLVVQVDRFEIRTHADAISEVMEQLDKEARQEREVSTKWHE